MFTDINHNVSDQVWMKNNDQVTFLSGTLVAYAIKLLQVAECVLPRNSEFITES